MKPAMLAALSVIFLLSGCNTVVRCGAGTIAMPDDVDSDGPGFFVAQDGDNYVDAEGNKYDYVTCKPALPVTVCVPPGELAPAVSGDEVHPDGAGWFVAQDGSGYFVAQDGTVAPEQRCELAEPAP